MKDHNGEPIIPNGWFQVGYGDELKPGDVVPMKYFDRDLVMFRTESGEAKVLDAFCPHLGAHLGHGGTVDGENIRCPFHAWEFDGTGTCTKVPYAKKIPPKAMVRTWHVREFANLIMVWHHGAGVEPEYELPEVPEYGDPDWSDADHRFFKIKAQNQEMAENAVDSAHFHYVHGTQNMPDSEGSTDGPVLRVASGTGMETPRGRVEGSVESLSYGFGFSAVRFKGLAETLLLGNVTPVDKYNVHVRFTFSVKKLGGADITRGVGAAFINEVERQLGQDIPIWENKVHLEKPMLCDGDGPIGMFRKWCKQFYTYPEAPAQPGAGTNGKSLPVVSEGASN